MKCLGYNCVLGMDSYHFSWVMGANSDAALHFLIQLSNFTDLCCGKIFWYSLYSTKDFTFLYVKFLFLVKCVSDLGKT